MHSFNPSTALVAAAAFMATLPAANAMYPKNSPVLQVGSKDYARLIEQSNHTSVSQLSPAPHVANR